MNQIIYRYQTVPPTYIDGFSFKKCDIIKHFPITLETQSTPPPAVYPYTVSDNASYLNKSRTYSSHTTFKQYPIELIANKNNPRDPNTPGSIGTDWYITNPGSIIEEGSNSNGSYTLYAGGILECNFTGFTRSTTVASTMWSPDSMNVNWTLPVVQYNKDFITAYAHVANGRYNWASCNTYVRTEATTKEYINTGSVWFDGNAINDVLVGVFYVKSTWY